MDLRRADLGLRDHHMKARGGTAVMAARYRPSMRWIITCFPGNAAMGLRFATLRSTAEAVHHRQPDVSGARGMGTQDTSGLRSLDSDDMDDGICGSVGASDVSEPSY